MTDLEKAAFELYVASENYYGAIEESNDAHSILRGDAADALLADARNRWIDAIDLFGGFIQGRPEYRDVKNYPPYNTLPCVENWAHAPNWSVVLCLRQQDAIYGQFSAWSIIKRPEPNKDWRYLWQGTPIPSRKLVSSLPQIREIMQEYGVTHIEDSSVAALIESGLGR